MRSCLHVVPVSVRGPPPQRYSRAKCTVPHRARTAPQSSDCVRERSLPCPAHFASLRSARPLAGTSLRSCARLLRNLRGSPPKASLSSAHRGGGGPRGWHGLAAVFAAPPLRHRESAFIREGPSIRRYGALGLVAMPPCANRIRPGGVLPLAAPDSLWPRGRHASPLARYRHMSVSAGRVPRTLH